MFFSGGSTGGHVAYGEVTPTGGRVVDNQLGVALDSLAAAETQLGMEARHAYRVESVTIP